jgi:hypothetical protein
MRKPVKDSTPRQTAQASEQAARSVEQENSTAGAGAQAPDTDAPSGEAQDGEAAKTNVAASRTAPGATAPPAVEFVSFSFPLPPGLPDDALNAALVVIKAKPERGRWRIGRKFTREETVIPYLDLDAAQQLPALIGDPELVVSLRVPKPG